MVIQVGDSTVAVKQEISDLLEYVTGDGEVTSWLNATNRINEVADLLGRDGIADGMAGATARARINALWDGPVWAPGADLAMDFREGLYYRGAVTDTHATDILALGSGGYETFAPNVLPRTDLGLLTTVGRTNKCENWNANPTDLTGLTTFDTGTGAAFEIVDDTAAILASPLGELLAAGIINGSVIKITPGTSTAGVIISGAAGNLNVHVASVFARTEAGGLVRANMQSDAGNNVSTTSTEYSRISLAATPVNETRSLVISSTAPGIPSYFILNQLEEGTFATDPIITEGSAVTRPGNRPVIDVTGRLSEGFGLVFQADLFAPSGAGDTRRILSINDGSTSNIALLGRTSGGSLQFSGLSGGSSIGSLSDTYAPGLQTFYLALSESFAGLGVVGGFEGTFTPSAYPTGMNQIGIGTEGINAGVNMYQQSKRLGMFFGPQDVSTFAQAKALAQEWAS